MSDDAKRFFDSNTSSLDFFRLMVGDKLGSGFFRNVYKLNHDPKTVVKFEDRDRSFANITEWDIWKNLSETKPELAKWLAPCVDISPCGTVLLQRFTADVTLKELPAKVPAFFTDLKVTNWGRLDGRIVCRDYGNHKLYVTGPSTRLVKANWFES